MKSKLTAMAAKARDLQAENTDLAKKLEVARGLADTNWIDAAIMIKAAQEKLGSQRSESAK